MTGEFLTMNSITAKVDLSPCRIYDLMKAGKFPAGKKYGYSRLWTAKEIEEWLSERTLQETE